MKFSPWVVTAVLVGSSLARAEDGGAVDAAVPATDGGNQAPAVSILVVGATAPCPAPCREVHTTRGLPLTFTANVTDAEMDTLSLLWDLESRPQGSLSELGTPTAAQSTLTPDVDGNYNIAFSAQDSAGNLARVQLLVVVEQVSFVPELIIKVDGSTVVCQPQCSREAVQIGSEVSADARDSLHDLNHGPFRFAWDLTTPPGSTITLKEQEPGRVTFLPDVDGTYQITVTVADDRDSQEVAASFVIPNVLHWKPLQESDFTCTSSRDAGTRAPWGVALLLLAAWTLRRRAR